MNVQDYVLGFAFSLDFKNVLLIEKTKPAWQSGKLNGIGGKVEDSDPSYEWAMCREFQEECGLFVHDEQWHRYATLDGDSFCVAVFWTSMPLETMLHHKSMTEEKVGIYNVRNSARPLNCISNVPALIELAMDEDVRSGRLANVNFSYK